MARELSLDDGQHEDNLLIEAVSLLVQRQRETESWVAEQIERAEQRSSTAERRYADLEDRLAGIESQLDRLVRDLEPGRPDAATGQRMARLREQVKDLRGETDGLPPRSAPPSPIREAAPEAPPPPAPAAREVEPAQTRPVPAAATSSGATSMTSVLELFGSTREDRFGLLLIFLGIVAVLYAVLTQLRLG